MAIQGKNAANAGDILKHPLICDVLQKCIDANWKNITYAETHAGAGIYSSLGQGRISSHDDYNSWNVEQLRKRKYHIVALFKAYCESKSNAPLNNFYWNILNNLWDGLEFDPDTEIKYAGSAYLAASILKATNEIFDIRLTEYNLEACHQLKNSLNGLLPTINVNDHIMQAGFQDQIDWLTANDNLVLIVDPFKLSFHSKGVNKGDIDLYHLLRLTERLKDKNAITGFWYSTDQDPIKNKMKLSSFFDKTIIENYEELNCRKYSFGNFYFIFIGFGAGKGIVNDLPSQSQLQNRWFQLEIKERLFPKRMKKLLRSIKDLTELNEEHKATLQNIIDQIDNLEI